MNMYSFTDVIIWSYLGSSAILSINFVFVHQCAHRKQYIIIIQAKSHTVIIKLV